ncbi:MAG TPA: hypothetical protein VGS28_04100 [Candidatus Saccharimonadales bacterium]|nr:hypothetical protein [Candidatus Saccharimonadales bacterium]
MTELREITEDRPSADREPPTLTATGRALVGLLVGASKAGLLVGRAAGVTQERVRTWNKGPYRAAAEIVATTITRAVPEDEQSGDGQEDSPALPASLAKQL